MSIKLSASLKFVPSRLHPRTKMVNFLFFHPKREIKTSKTMLFNMRKNMESLKEHSWTRWLEDGEEGDEGEEEPTWRTS